MSHIREIGDDGDTCRYEEMNTHLKNPVGGRPGYAYPSRDEPSLAEMIVSLIRLCERCTRILHLHLPHLHCEGEGGYVGDEGEYAGDGLQVSGSSGKIDHLLMDAHPSISAGFSAIPDLLDV